MLPLRRDPGRAVSRWLVERADGEFEDVGANVITIVDGCLKFQNSIFESPVYLVAAGQWRTVSEAAE